MSAASLAALLTAITGVVGAIAALLHSIQTRRQVNGPQPPVSGSNTPANQAHQ